MVTPAKDSSKTQHAYGAFPGASYQAYLDSICPRLLAVDEDRILAESKRDPRVLIGLVLEGSTRGKRAKEWLSEALRKAPDDPLVLATILSRPETGFDRRKLAVDLIGLFPDHADPLYAAANESLKAGNREAAITFLKEAAQRESFSSLHLLGVEARLNVYRLAGRSEQSALARIYLDDRAGLAEMALVELNNTMGPFDRSYAISAGNDEVAALLLDGIQKTLYSPGRTLDHHRIAREMEISYLRAFLRSNLESKDAALATRYLDTPPAEMLASATTERQEFDKIGLFSQDKPGVFQRLTSKQQIELIERIRKSGEVSAYQWAYLVRPDIFRSPDFAPMGFTKEIWNARIQAISQ